MMNPIVLELIQEILDYIHLIQKDLMDNRKAFSDAMNAGRYDMARQLADSAKYSMRLRNNMADKARQLWNQL